MLKRIINKRNIFNRGYTITELLVVIIVIGVLAAVVMVSYSGVQAKAKDTSVLSDMDRMDSLQTNYSMNHVGVAGKTYNSANGVDADLGFTPTTGNIILVRRNN